MARTVRCPSCQVELTIPDAAEGRKLKCPKCATRFPVPGGEVRTPSQRPAEAPAKKAKVPPSSGTVSSHRRSADDIPLLPVDFRDLDDIPLSREYPTSKRPGSSNPAVADVAALFDDDEPRRSSSRLPTAEARKHARRCSSCSAVIPIGMSLCNGCGLDQDTGVRIDLVEEIDEMPVAQAPAGPPASILVVGLLCTVAAGVLAVYSFFGMGGYGGIALGGITLYGLVGSIIFTIGKSIKMMTIALMLGAFVNVVTMIAVPVIVANLYDDVAPVDLEGPPKAEPGPDDPAPAAEPKIQPLAERMDMAKITWGVIILLLDAVVLAYINSPPIRRHFEHKHHYPEDVGPIAL